MIERYQTVQMQTIWADSARFARWTEVEKAVGEAWYRRGVIAAPAIELLRGLVPPTAPEILAIEAQTHHDVAAFVQALGLQVDERCRCHIHRGLTSSDVVDTALAMAMRDSLEVLIAAATGLAGVLAIRAREHKRTVCVGRTHGVHAEPTTFGLRLAGWYAEINRHADRLRAARREISFGKLSGAIGTSSQIDPEFEREVLATLRLDPEPVATQVVPRDRHAAVLNTLALLGAGIERLATNVRALQRTEIHEVEESFGQGQIGLSAMPHKRNPITSERLCGLARLLRGYALAGLEDVALWDERDISHSSVERVALPDAFHLVHNMLLTATDLFASLKIFPERMRQNIEQTHGLVFSQNVLTLLINKGQARTDAHAAVQRAAARVWDGGAKDLTVALREDGAIAGLVSADELGAAMSSERFLVHVDVLFDRSGIKDDKCQQ